MNQFVNTNELKDFVSQEFYTKLKGTNSIITDTAPVGSYRSLCKKHHQFIKWKHR